MDLNGQPQGIAPTSILQTIIHIKFYRMRGHI